jgi:hypothetical protein
MGRVTRFACLAEAMPPANIVEKKTKQQPNTFNQSLCNNQKHRTTSLVHEQRRHAPNDRNTNVARPL